MATDSALKAAREWHKSYPEFSRNWHEEIEPCPLCKSLADLIDKLNDAERAKERKHHVLNEINRALALAECDLKTGTARIIEARKNLALYISGHDGAAPPSPEED